jgi:hypothetical protein
MKKSKVKTHFELDFGSIFSGFLVRLFLFRKVFLNEKMSLVSTTGLD